MRHFTIALVSIQYPLSCHTQHSSRNWPKSWSSIPWFKNIEMLRAVCKNNTSELQDLVQLRDEHNIHVSLLNKEINLEGNKNHSFCGYNDTYVYILVYILFF